VNGRKIVLIETLRSIIASGGKQAITYVVVVYQFQNIIQVKKTQNCVSPCVPLGCKHADGLVFDVSTPWRGQWQKNTKQCFGWYFSKLIHDPLSHPAVNK
jgi:hypothetical protein